MKKLLRAGMAALVGALALSAHPMGNFSVNHYTRIEVGPGNTKVLFVLDLAEIPSFELLQKWGLQASSPRAELERKAVADARGWVRQLRVTVNGKAVIPVFNGADLVVADGAGGLPVLRVNSHLTLPGQSGTLSYSDGTYPDRTAGWKEVVVAARAGAVVEKSSVGDKDRSQALTAYPQDPTLSPPQDLTATVSWSGGDVPARPLITKKTAPVTAPVAAPVAPLAAPLATAAPGTAATVTEPNSMGQVKRGDFLSKALQGREIGWGLGLICVAVAFWFGALHALEPGHGKTMVAAYLVGERGTPKHAILLGGMVTFTHTVSVFILGLMTMFLSRYIMPDVISKWLGVISGLVIVWIGGLLLYRRARSLSKAAHSHEHSHSHFHEEPAHAHVHGPGGHVHSHAPNEHSHTHEPGHSHPHSHEEPAHAHVHGQGGHMHSHAPSEHSHSHEHGHSHPHTHDHEPAHSHSHAHEHGHSHGGLTHTHDGHTHSHVIEGEISMKSLMALGASGGLVPCPSALVLLLSAVSIGRTGFGLLLLVSFSLGLALVLMATGLLVLYAKKFFPKRKDNKPGAFLKIMPVVSAAVILLIGVVLTGNALGLIPVIRFFG